LAQWGYGAEAAELPVASDEKFVPAPPSLRTANIELRSEAMLSGGEIRLKQIVRWAHADNSAIAQTGDLVIAHFERGQSSRIVDLDEVKATLQQAGVNLAAVNFNGALACKVTRSDAGVEVGAEQPVTALIAKLAPTTAPSVIAALNTLSPVEGGGTRTLKELLLASLADRFSLPAETFQLRFSTQDEKLAGLSEPLFHFDIERPIQRDIGEVTWQVAISTPAGMQRATISANVRAWQTRLFAARPIVTKQQFHDEDLVERRLLVDRLGDELALTKAQVVGQQAARDIGVGIPLTSQMIEAMQLARVGELVDVFVERGRIQLKWVAEARENGSLGQAIRVRKIGERDEFTIVLTGQRQGRLVGITPSDVTARR
jgi:flagella basal body P-ring formation protein FlgA